MSTKDELTTSSQHDAKLPVVRRFSNIFVEIEGKHIPISDLSKQEYEEFLNDMHKLRLAYISITSRP